MTPLITSRVCQDGWRSSGVEQRFCKPPVGGSNPFASSTGGAGEARPSRRSDEVSPRYGGVCGGAGEVPEWPKGAGCKPAGLCLRRFESFPLHQAGVWRERARSAGGNSSVGRASAFQAEGRGFESRFPLHAGRGWSERRSRSRAHVAQSAERVLGKDEVTGSTPVMGSSTERGRDDGTT